MRRPRAPLFYLITNWALFEVKRNPDTPGAPARVLPWRPLPPHTHVIRWCSLEQTVRLRQKTDFQKIRLK